MDTGCVISAGAGPTRCMVANGYQPRSQHWHWVKQPFWSFWLALLGAVQPHVMHSWYLNGSCLEMLPTHTRTHTLTLTLTLTHGDRYMCHNVFDKYFFARANYYTDHRRTPKTFHCLISHRFPCSSVGRLTGETSCQVPSANHISSPEKSERTWKRKRV